LDTLIRTAGTAPSGANKQPWRFIVVTDPELKRKIRIAAEKEEKQNYERRMSQEWLNDLAVLGTDWHKEFLETAPALIAVFSVEYEKEDGRIRRNYYVKESVGLAVGFLILAIHNAGLVSLTHTPSPMHFLQKLLDRPSNERPFVLIPVGYPAEDVMVPNIQRKPLDRISVWQ
jgi:nitroreductase